MTTDRVLLDKMDTLGRKIRLYLSNVLKMACHLNILELRIYLPSF